MSKKQVILTVIVCILIVGVAVYFTTSKYSKMKKETNKKIERIEKNKKKKQENKKNSKNKKKEQENKKNGENEKKEQENIKNIDNEKKEAKEYEEASYRNKKKENVEADKKTEERKKEDEDEPLGEKEAEIDRYKITLDIDKEKLKEIKIKKEDIILKCREFAINKGLFQESIITYDSKKVSPLNDKRVYYYFELQNSDLQEEEKLKFTIENYNGKLYVRDGFFE